MFSKWRAVFYAASAGQEPDPEDDPLAAVRVDADQEPQQQASGDVDRQRQAGPSAIRALT